MQVVKTNEAARERAAPGSNARKRTVAEAKDNIREPGGQGFTAEAVAKLAALRGDKAPFSDRTPLDAPDADFDVCLEFLPGILAADTGDAELVAIGFSISTYLIPPANGERGLVVVNSFVPEPDDDPTHDATYTRAVQVDAEITELLTAWRENGEAKMLPY